MRSLPLFINKTLANALNNLIRAEDLWSPFPACVRNEEQEASKLLRFYPEVVNYMLKKYTTGQATAENEGAIQRCVRSPNMTLRQHADDLIAKSCKSIDVNDERILNGYFIEGVDAPIWRNLRNYMVANPKDDKTDIVFQPESLLFIQRSYDDTLTNN